MATAGDQLAQMDDATVTYGGTLARVARQYAPVRTGRLRASIRVDGPAVVASAPYAAAVEYGRGRGRRYMARAVESTAREVDKTYTDSAQEITDKIKGA
jgi:hypothetical protein